MKKWSDGVVTSHLRKKTYNSFREELAYLDVTFKMLKLSIYQSKKKKDVYRRQKLV